MKLIKIIIFIFILATIASFIPMNHEYCDRGGCNKAKANFWQDLKNKELYQRM